ncbi:MAG: hypothetical protein RMJ55_08760 [Roseiflexaceae bacterium]|nr:hypothetical protein [Roseiflexus sp.]MDW8213635.1 hypothetical protein [Roseiflexaceae bacterium]
MAVIQDVHMTSKKAVVYLRGKAASCEPFATSAWTRHGVYRLLLGKTSRLREMVTRGYVDVKPKTVQSD